ncbi:CBU_0592 family membrane protein [Tateyamaria sp. SN3-11]|uniref:CBU_0592 family membrane protein n=1 Tax=Tateyamaria sp. SN3-11 TaxID=3092147 RepID=UPI0039EB25C5
MSFLTTVPAHVLEAIGVIGFCLYVMNYALLTFHRLNSNSRLYFAINIIAASCVLIGLAASFNLAAALIQIFWVAMSIIGLVLRLRGSGLRPV